MRLEVLPVPGIGEVAEGDDLVALIATTAPWLRDGDVLVVTSKIVSKAEGRLVAVPQEGPEREAAREAVLVAETAHPVARRGNTRIVRTHHGFVMAAAGIDASNVHRDRLVLLPKDPDASARTLRAGLRDRHGVDVAVIISDTMGRPWRNGLTDVALGVAGMAAIRDHRGEVDSYGNELHVTQMAVVDELAGAAELVKGKCDGVPVAVVRGYPRSSSPDDQAGVSVLIRGPEQDLFPLGAAEARADGLRAAATLTDGPGAATTLTDGSGAAATTLTGDSQPHPPVAVDEVAVSRAIATVAGAVASGTVFTLVTDARERVRLADALPGWPAAATGALLGTPPPGPVTDHPATLIRFGADVHRLRAALAAEGIPSTALTASGPIPGVTTPGDAPPVVLAL